MSVEKYDLYGIKKKTKTKTKKKRNMIVSLICREYNKKKQKKKKLSYVVYQGMEFEGFHINSIKIVIVPLLQTVSLQACTCNKQRASQ